MKKFIEVSAYGKEFTIATRAIIGVTDQGESKGCLISLTGPISGLTSGGTVAAVSQPYTIVLAQIEEAEQH